jgi:hypothetical protein
MASNGPDNRGHLVSTQLEGKDKRCLLIHDCGPATGSFHGFHFTLKENKTVKFRRGVSASTIEELGWFRDLGLFLDICQDESLVLENSQFDAWVSTILRKIRKEHGQI